MKAGVLYALLSGASGLIICQAALAQTTSPQTASPYPLAAGTAPTVGTTAGVPAASAGNDPDQATAPAETKNEQADIIVTAQRRSGTLSRTPVAISVISSDTLREAQITTQSDLQLAVPGLQVRAGANSNQLNFAIRGQSVDAYSSSRPGVLPYFNEVVLGGEGSVAIYDLQSVQVLKGPQGTLFGRNAIGGAVLFQSEKPSEDFGGYIDAGLGTYNARKFEGAINVPIVSDTVLARISGTYEKRDGFQVNLIDGSRRGNVDRWGMRGSLTIKPVEGIRNDLVVDYQHVDGDGTVAVIRTLDPTGAFPTASLYSNATFPAGSGPLTGTSVSDYVLGLTLQSLGLPAGTANAIANGNYARYIAANPTVNPVGIADFLAKQNARGPYRIETNNPNTHRGRNLIITNTTSFDVGADTQIRNVFGYGHINNFDILESDGSPQRILESTGNHIVTTQFSDELQLVGKALGSKLSYVIGGFFSDENVDRNAGTFQFDIIPLGNAKNTSWVRKDRTYAGYAQGTYDTGLGGLGIIAGLRYTSERLRSIIRSADSNFTLATTGVPALGIPASAFDNDRQKTIGNLSYTLGLQEQATQQLLLYVTTRRSYRDGNYNPDIAPRVGSIADGGNSFDTERLDDVELGAKFNGRVADIPTRANFAVYHDWIKNDQRTIFTVANGTLSAITANVPTSRVYGFEFDGQIIPARWLTIGGSTAYTNARFTGNNSVTIGGTATPFLYYTDTPKWVGGIFADVTIPLGGNLAMIGHADGYGQKGTQSSSTSSVPLPGYALANFRLGITDKSAGWSLTAVLKNAFDRTYYVGGLPVGSLVQINTAVPGDRRTFLVQASYKF